MVMNIDRFIAIGRAHRDAIVVRVRGLNSRLEESRILEFLLELASIVHACVRFDMTVGLLERNFSVKLKKIARQLSCPGTVRTQLCAIIDNHISIDV
jgi:hypothetical protein